MNLVLSIGGVLCSLFLLWIAFLAAGVTSQNLKTARINKETADLNMTIMNVAVKMVQDSSDREAERQKWIGLYLEEKAE